MSTKYSELPQLPAPLKGFLPYLADHSDVPVQDLLLPYRHYDSKVREIFAQEPDHPALAEDLINVVPIFDKAHALTLRARARNMEAETEQQKARFIMPLKAADRKEIGSPAVVPTLKGFRDNFNVFSELSLSELDWNNVVAAGSSVVSALLPVPEEYNTSKRSLRKYYHEISAPASDVDLFLYGLTEQQAVEKMKYSFPCAQG